ncbi:MAG: outer membrane protein OmpW [Proteobacteria bacterium]|nr:MAG: outer membrane protein OmpW [Pseudomonadota bacterium]
MTTVVTTATTSGAVLAHEKGDLILRAGPILVEPREDSSSIRVDSPELGYVAGAKVGVGNNVQLGLTATYMLTDQIGVEVLAATPFKHDVYAAGAIAGVGKLGSTKHLPPTVSVQYYLPFPEDKFQPYVGAGINYTIFFQEDTTGTLTDSIGVLASLAETPVSGVTATSTDLELDDSVGASLQLGFDYAITDKFGINAAAWWIDIDTEATVTAETNAGTVTATTDVKIDPWVYFISASYKF